MHETPPRGPAHGSTLPHAPARGPRAAPRPGSRGRTPGAPAPGPLALVSFFFFNDPAPPEISPLPLHDALPISFFASELEPRARAAAVLGDEHDARRLEDRKSTRLNSSHDQISYAVFCLKK